nr:retrovirus-related Pol polyprotein from transposon TNT 1-94 [Tanacetum cinerariifolium]
DIPSIKKVEQINKIDFINAGGIDFESEEIEDFLNDDSILFGVEDSPFNMDEDILFLESLLRDDPIPPHPIIPNQTKLLIEETNHSLNMGYEHFYTNLVTKDVAESSTKNLMPIPNECMIVSENGSQSTEPISDNSLDSTIISNPLSDVESNFDESTSNHDTKKRDYLDEFYGPFIPIHILEEERTIRAHADYINQMEMLFTINPCPHNSTNDNTNIESFSLFPIPNQEKSVNGKKYILVIVDDYSRFTWVKFLRSKDETPMFIIKFLKMIQVRLNVPVRRIRTDNGTEFVNQTLRDYYEEVGISHETSVARSPQQNRVVERRNRTLIEAVRIMLIYAQAPLFLWAEAVATACFTQNRSIIRLRHGKTPYELMHGKQPDLSYFHVFGALCYPTNDGENVDKLQPKADIGIFIRYAPSKKAFRIYNRRTRRIVETIHVDFDELIAMASEQNSSGPALQEMIPGTISSGLVQKPSSSTSYVPPSRNDW